MARLSDKIPSFVWLLIIVGAIGLFIGAILTFFYGIGYVEGFGSLILLVLGWIGFRVGNNSSDSDVGGFGVALGIAFFALMGMALDQTGNLIYNRPLEWIFCPEASELTRETIRRGVRGGGVTLSQNFACVSQNGVQIVRQISGFEHFAFRFIEYVALGYVLLGLSRFYSKIKGFRHNASNYVG